MAQTHSVSGAEHSLTNSIIQILYKTFHAIVVLVVVVVIVTSTMTQ
jgi:hypothetical protein